MAAPGLIRARAGSAARAQHVVTWNVLHRVHAINWHEPVVEQWPDERARADAIADEVEEWLRRGAHVVCLQEVSGDLLARLQRTVDLGIVFEHTYPRVPRLRAGGETALTAGTEHLVLIARASETRRVASETFASDPGKGYLAVEVGDVLVICTHLSFGERRAAQLATIAARMSEAPHGAILLGDTNASLEDVRAGLGLELAASALPPGTKTRLPTGDHAGSTIDHVLALGGTVEEAEVLDARGLSDHAPVRALVTFG